MRQSQRSYVALKMAGTLIHFLIKEKFDRNHNISWANMLLSFLVNFASLAAGNDFDCKLHTSFTRQ